MPLQGNSIRIVLLFSHIPTYIPMPLLNISNYIMCHPIGTRNTQCAAPCCCGCMQTASSKYRSQRTSIVLLAPSNASMSNAVSDVYPPLSHNSQNKRFDADNRTYIAQKRAKISQTAAFSTANSGFEDNRYRRM